MENLFDTGEFLTYNDCSYLITSNISVVLESLECMLEDKVLGHQVIVSGCLVQDPLTYPGVLWEDKTSRMDTRVARDIEEYFVGRININCYGLIKTPLLADIIVLDQCKISRTKSKAMKRVAKSGIPVAKGDDPRDNSLITDANTFAQGELIFVTAKAFDISSDDILVVDGIEYNIDNVKETIRNIVEITVNTR